MHLTFENRKSQQGNACGTLILAQSEEMRRKGHLEGKQADKRGKNMMSKEIFVNTYFLIEIYFIIISISL